MSNYKSKLDIAVAALEINSVNEYIDELLKSKPVIKINKKKSKEKLNTKKRLF